jgi:hypothetical protein
VECDPKRKTKCSRGENWEATEKSEAFATCKEMPVIPVNRVVDKKIIMGRKGAEEEEKGTRGC